MALDIGPFDDGPGQGVRRMIALASYLDTVPEHDYDHRTWRRRRSDGSWAMCALGHGVTALPDLLGLRWRDAESLEVVRLDGSGITEHPLTLVAEAFDLTDDEAAMIFGVGLNTVAFYGPRGIFGLKPAAVAAAIRDFASAKMAASLHQALAPVQSLPIKSLQEGRHVDGAIPTAQPPATEPA